MRLSSSGFSPAEVDEVKKQPFVQKLGLFTANQFQSYARSSTTIPFSTVLFFEAVPDEFLDVIPPDFHWEPGSVTVPIMLSQDFLNLYNFGFALSQGLPQLSRTAISMVPLSVEVSGPKGKADYKGKICGFSDRYSTVLVPQSFMDWANKNIGEGKPSKPNRLILQVSNAADPALTAFLEKNGYQTNSDKLKMGKAGGIIKVVMGLISLLGILFIALSLVIFSTNFRAVIAEAKDEIKLLIELGYTARSLAVNLLSYFSAYLLLLSLGAGTLVWLGTEQIRQLLEKQGMEAPVGYDPRVWLLGLGFILFTLLVNSVTVFRLLKRIR